MVAGKPVIGVCALLAGIGACTSAMGTVVLCGYPLISEMIMMPFVAIGRVHIVHVVCNCASIVHVEHV
jgi:hypothetical protein